MNAGAAMRLLLAGKTLVYEDGARLRLIGGELCIEHRHIEDGRTYEPRDMSLFVGLQEFKEYPLTYAQAWEAMLDGKVVMCEASERYAFRFRDGVLEHSCQDDEFTMWENGVVLMDMNGSKWKVVE